MKKSFMTRALAMGLSFAMAFSLSAATNVTTASAAAKKASVTTFMKASSKTVTEGKSVTAYMKSDVAKKYRIKSHTENDVAKKYISVKMISSRKGLTITAKDGAVTAANLEKKGVYTKIYFAPAKSASAVKKATATKYINLKVAVKAVPKQEEKPEKPVEEALALTDVKQVASNQIKVIFNKDASANAKDAYKIAAEDGTKEIGVRAVTYAEDGKSALIDTYANVDNGVTYIVTVGELTGKFTASAGEVASISISTANAQQNVKTPINFTLFDANGIDVTPSVNLDSTCVITLNGNYVAAEKEKASAASVTMGTVGSTVDVTITYNKGVTGSEIVSATQTITCVAAAQTIGNSVFATTTNTNARSECAKFYLDNPKLSDKLVTVKENASTSDVYFCAKDGNGDVISYDNYEVESSNDDVATVSVVKDSGKYMKLIVNGNSVGSANLNVSASKNGVPTAYTIPVQVYKGTTAIKMVATASRPTMSNVKDDDYKCEIKAKLLDANGKEVDGQFTYNISKVVAEDQPSIELNGNIVKADGATAGTYSIKVTGSENLDGSCAFEQNVQIQVKDLPKEAYIATSAGIKVTYQVELTNTAVDENPSLKNYNAKTGATDSTEVRLYAMYDGLFAGYVNDDGSVSDVAKSVSVIGPNKKGIRVATSSAIFSPKVGVKFGNQYFKPSATNAVELFNPSGARVTTAAITTKGAVGNLNPTYNDYLSALGSTNKVADLTIKSVDHSGTKVLCGDVSTKGALQWKSLGRTGTYTVEYYYDNEKGTLTKNPIIQTFTVTNSLTKPKVNVTSKKVSSFNEDKLKTVMKASVDMNNNVSSYESICDLTNGVQNASGTYPTNLSDGVLSADGLKTTYKYAIVEDNFGSEKWHFFVPINTTFSYQ